MQLDTLWQFMQVDMEADGFETKMRQSANRQKLIKQRDFLKDQQANMKKLENDVAVMQDRLEAVQDEADRLEKVLANLSEEISANPPQNVEEAQKQAESVQKLLDTLTRYEQELQKMRKDADTKDRQQKEIRVRAAKTKQEFDQLKVEYDKEFKEDTAKLQKMRARTDEEAKKIEPGLLEQVQEHQAALHAAHGEAGQRPVQRLLHVAAQRHAAGDPRRQAHRGVRQLRPHTLRRGGMTTFFGFHCEGARRSQAFQRLRKVRAPQGRVPVNCR